MAVAIAGINATGYVALNGAAWAVPSLLIAGIGAAVCIIAAVLAAAAVHYLAGVDPTHLSEAAGLVKERA
jgi:hypothetical protein